MYCFVNYKICIVSNCVQYNKNFRIFYKNTPRSSHAAASPQRRFLNWTTNKCKTPQTSRLIKRLSGLGSALPHGGYREGNKRQRQMGRSGTNSTFNVSGEYAAFMASSHCSKRYLPVMSLCQGYSCRCLTIMSWWT